MDFGFGMNLRPDLQSCETVKSWSPCKEQQREDLLTNKGLGKFKLSPSCRLVNSDYLHTPNLVTILIETFVTTSISCVFAAWILRLRTSPRSVHRGLD